MTIRQLAVEQWSVPAKTSATWFGTDVGACMGRQQIACRAIVELQWGRNQSWAVKCRKDTSGEARLYDGGGALLVLDLTPATFSVENKEA